MDTKNTKESLLILDNNITVKYNLFFDKFYKKISFEIVDINIDNSDDVLDLSSFLLDKIKKDIIKEEFKNYTIDDSKIEIRVCLKDVKKTFPKIRKLIFSTNFTDIDISNLMFPNVRKVKIETINPECTRYFINGNMLISRNGKLCNTFCRQKDEVIDLSNICSIREGAFEGCSSIKIKNVEEFIWDLELLKGYVFSQESPFISKFDTGNIFDLKDSKKQILKEVFYNIDELTIIAHNVEHLDYILKLNHFNSYLYKQNKILKLNLIIDISNDIPIKNLCDICDMSTRDFYSSIIVNSIKISESNTQYKIVDDIIYSYDGKILFSCLSKKCDEVIIPEGVEFIFNSAFSFNKKITSIKLPDSLRYIGDKAFRKMPNLKFFDFGNGISRIDGTYVLSENNNLKEVIIPKNIHNIGHSMFYNCKSLKKVIIEEGVEEIDSSAFSNCNNIEYLELPSSIKNISAEIKEVQNITINSNKYIPTGLIKAFMKHSYQNSNNEISIYGKTIHDIATGNTFYLPEKLLMKTISELEMMFNTCLFLTKKPIELKKYCNDDIFVVSSLLKDNPNNKKLKNILKNKESKIVDYFINNAIDIIDFEMQLIEFIKLDFMSLKQLNKLLDYSNKHKHVVLSSYLLDFINKKENLKNNLFEL